MIRWTLAAVAMGGFLPYIDALYPLKKLVTESEVAFGVVESTDPQAKVCVLKFTKTLKGRMSAPQVRINLATGWSDWQRVEAAKQLVPGAQVVVLDGARPPGNPAGMRRALVYINRVFVMVKIWANKDEPPTERWEFEQFEILLNRTYNGTPEELSALLEKALMGRHPYPAPDPRIPTMKKEDLLALPPPGTKVAEAELPAPFRRIVETRLRVPENPATVAPGLRFDYYEGVWKDLPDFAALNPVAGGVTAQFDPAERRRDKDVALRFTGFLEVPQDGTYVLSTAATGPHRIVLGTQELRMYVEKHCLEVGVDLKAGRHAFAVLFVDGGRGGALKVFWQGPGQPSRQPIPAAALVHVP